MLKSAARFAVGVSAVIMSFAVLPLTGLVRAGDMPAERVIDLDGTTNTRDIGGYETRDGRTLLWRQIIRSEKLSRLTAHDFQMLEEIGIRTVIDLRTHKEHRKSPTVWMGDHPPRFFHFPIGDASNDWFQAQRAMIKRNQFTEKQSRALMVDGYHMIATEGVESYRKLMEVVKDPDNWPLLMHCSAGKDRAGVAAALILEAVGVERQTIMDDYLLSNELGRSQDKAELMARESRKNRRGRASPTADAWFPVVGVDSEMLEAFYATVEHGYGSVDGFLERLGMDTPAREALTQSLTIEQPGMAMGE